MKQMHKVVKLFMLSLSVGFFTACADYLDVVPDGVATIDNAFSNRINSEKFLFSCYNMLPNQNDPWNYPGNTNGDEIWWDIEYTDLCNQSGPKIATGDQNTNSPYQNYWDGDRGGKKLWIGIRDCNIFLENIGRVPDLSETERLRWISEVKFIKAYLHFFLMELYGPIPIVDVNLEVNEEPEKVRVKREPVEKVIEYIVELLDDSMENLPDYIEDSTNEMGRITKSIAASIKAKVLVWGASPLFNGNPDYTNFQDKDGVQMIPIQKDDTKWEKAAEAIKAAIEISHQNGHALYQYKPSFEVMSDITKQKYTLRGAVCERPMNNPEIIWAHTAGNNTYQNYCTPKLHPSYVGTSELSAPLKIAEQYYTMNGVPIEEDTKWDYAKRYEIRRDTGSFHKYYIKAGETTAMLHYYREPRFYAHLAFDRSLYESQSQKEDETVMIQNRSGEVHGLRYSASNIMTGYFIKKLVSFRSSSTSNSPSPYTFKIPIIRLVDLYLLYAEALNEVKDKPDAEVYEWVDKIRERAGLKGVVESWSQHSNIPGKPLTKEGMREIIKQERLIELAFEGQRFFDLRRWKDAMHYMNEPIQGWDFRGQKAEEYYEICTYFKDRNYTTKEYLWPLRLSTIIRNTNLEQNPGW
ncbi:RagB/SusD family nutrient uptake outer membrane protein [Parabacteroides goldsteinii]|uniref:RagB/SusD family nutrient uptake outer membrane protein n=1 Tax=Parabacteroides goldsteinii TaxID=328812 RepID=UPI003AF0DDD9